MPTPEPAEPEPGEPAPVGPVAAIVRPYVLTGGQNRASCYLGVETLVSAHRPGTSSAGAADVAHRTVVELCARPKAVAEVAALMMVPLDVARVLVGDLIQADALFVHRGPTAHGSPDTALMSRVLRGLQLL